MANINTKPITVSVERRRWLHAAADTDTDSDTDTDTDDNANTEGDIVLSSSFSSFSSFPSWFFLSLFLEYGTLRPSFFTSHLFLCT